jgi:hypothetical protein
LKYLNNTNNISEIKTILQEMHGKQEQLSVSGEGKFTVRQQPVFSWNPFSHFVAMDIASVGYDKKHCRVFRGTYTKVCPSGECQLKCPDLEGIWITCNFPPIKRDAIDVKFYLLIRERNLKAELTDECVAAFAADS